MLNISTLTNISIHLHKYTHKLKLLTDIELSINNTHTVHSCLIYYRLLHFAGNISTNDTNSYTVSLTIMSLLTVVFWALLLPKITNLVCLISVSVLIWEKWADLLRNDRNSLRAPGTGHICLLNSACWLWVEWRLENSVGKYEMTLLLVTPQSISKHFASLFYLFLRLCLISVRGYCVIMSSLSVTSESLELYDGLISLWRSRLTASVFHL